MRFLILSYVKYHAAERSHIYYCSLLIYTILCLSHFINNLICCLLIAYLIL